MFGDVRDLQQSTTHAIYLILKRRSKAFHWRQNHFEILQHIKNPGGGAPTPPFVPRWGVWICMYVGWLNYSAACEVTFRPRVVVLALEHKGLIIGLHCTLFKAGINAKPSSIDLIHPFIWSLLRKDRPGRLIYSTDDRCYGNKCNGVCGCLHFSLGVLSQVAAVEENCNDRHYCFKLISHWLNWGF